MTLFDSHNSENLGLIPFLHLFNNNNKIDRKKLRKNNARWNCMLEAMLVEALTYSLTISHNLT